ncbi:Platelet-activating factor acetylhydrolase [Tetrabaena socialis]|uniref:1-alkyl-2-acetylglycerophosphocholine esterase n=1 Tax=Tetrabaena socialis TaxID=47790 RepID=A0A2J8AFJ0_9CHLO|nr:Platelet-activating factor acetylhydrolase [Tetrabaena socialis]|eukprot:PNH11287.1 Platelet-activating factor acetylhydrolase [Tetrabaena socialis]
MNPPRHPVGVVDLGALNLELAASTSGSDASEGDPHRLAGRLFYPCVRQWTWACTWIPHANYARGYVGESQEGRYLFKMVPKGQQATLKNMAAKAVLTSIAWVLGASKVLPVYYRAPLSSPEALPLIIFSHGIAGTRNAYSSICTELASQGYVVMALEHGDGSASAARLPKLAPTPPPQRPAPAPESGAGAQADSEPSSSGSSAASAPGGGATAAADGDGSRQGAGGKGAGGFEFCFYGGFGDKAEQLRKTRYRVTEGVLELPAAVAASLKGKIDLSRAAVIGHSYGGATAAAAAAQLPCFRAAVSLDPWWDCFDDQWPVLNRWANPAPLLVIGSDDWNTPNAEGKLKCGGVNQERVLAAAAGGGGGAVLVVPSGSTHGSFDDVLLFFGRALTPMARLFNIRSSLEPRLALSINTWCISHFLGKHMPPRACTAAAAPEAAALLPAVRESDMDAYKEKLGDKAAILRVCAGVRA